MLTLTEALPAHVDAARVRSTFEMVCDRDGRIKRVETESDRVGSVPSVAVSPVFYG
jgi:hypothetical protein